MSFSSAVKEEVASSISNARHCLIAEIAAIVSLCGKIKIDTSNGPSIVIQSENIGVIRKCFTMIKKAFNISTEVSIRKKVKSKKGSTYSLVVRDEYTLKELLKAIKINDDITKPVSNLVTMNSCCKRAYIRGAFLANGSISDPEKFYHFEIACPTLDKAEQLKKVINSFDIDAKVITRKKYFIVYVKEGSGIVDVLNVIEAHVALMEFENIRILKDMRNSVNRKVNCETANINKTVFAAVDQIDAIRNIEKAVGLNSLAPELEQTAIIRLENPSASLKELGEMLDPPVGKSGVNHRLRKICKIADDLGYYKEESYGK